MFVFISFVIYSIVTVLFITINHFFVRRLDSVRIYRSILLDKIGECVYIDIRRDKDWRWRYKVFNSITFDSMIYKFWKPVDSFYKDKSFIESEKIAVENEEW